MSKLPQVIHVKAGQPVNAEIPYAGTAPNIKWTKDGQGLSPHQKTKSGMVSPLFKMFRHVLHIFSLVSIGLK